MEHLTRRFFESLIVSDALETADRATGRLRAYLLTMAKRFQIDGWRRQGAQKRGGDVAHVSLESINGEAGVAGWRATQFEPVRREVAVKIIKLGMDTEEVVARFENERQALAAMDHPNIAVVFDAGATADRFRL